MHKINSDWTIIYNMLVYDRFSVSFAYMLQKIDSTVDDKNEFAFKTKHVNHSGK